MRVITIPLPDPGALSWRERADMRNVTADALRAELGTDEPIGVDLVASGDVVP